MDLQRAMLDELMELLSLSLSVSVYIYIYININNLINCGSIDCVNLNFGGGREGRNLTEEERKEWKEVRWDSKEVCAFYMARFCPHDLFVNTKSDLGTCSRIHDPKLKESFEKSPRHGAFLAKFEGELATRCEKLVMDLDRKVRRGRERLAQGDEPMPPPPVSAEKSEQLAVVEEKMRNLLVQVESLGEAGKVDEAQALMKKVDELNAEKTLLQKQSGKLLAVLQEKKLAMCEICGSFLVANDAIERTQSHILGKQHIGYGMVRDFISEFKEAKEKAKEEDRVAREKETEERKKQREIEPDKRRSDSGERDRYNDRDRYREPDRDRDRDRAREWNGRDNQDRRSRNGRDTTRDKYRVRSRSRSPVRRGHRRASRSPARPS